MTTLEASHWIKMTGPLLEEWRGYSKNFLPKELASKGNGSVFITKEALTKLQRVRDLYGKPIIINSAYRDPIHNVNVGGSPNSQHVKGQAFDIHIPNHTVGRELERIALEAGFTSIGRYKNFLHIDCRPAKADGSVHEWGTWS